MLRKKSSTKGILGFNFCQWSSDNEFNCSERLSACYPSEGRVKMQGKPVLWDHCRSRLHKRKPGPRNPHFLSKTVLSFWQTQEGWILEIPPWQPSWEILMEKTKMGAIPWQPSLSSNHWRAKQSLETWKI